MMINTETIHDQFSIDLNLHHPSCDPGEITKALLLEPWFSRRAGDQLGDVVHRQTSWLCHFEKGAGDSEFGEALERMASLLCQHEAFFSEFTGEGGKVEVVLNSRVELEEGKLLELCLHPWFLNQLSTRNVSLRIQAWKSDSA